MRVDQVIGLRALSIDIASYAVDVVQSSSLDARPISRKLIRAASFAVASLIIFVGAVLYVRFGPRLEAEAATLAILVILSFGSLFVFALASLVVTASTALVLQQLKLREVQLEVCEAVEENRILVQVLDDLGSQNPERVEGVMQRYRAVAHG